MIAAGSENVTSYFDLGAAGLTITHIAYLRAGFARVEAAANVLAAADLVTAPHEDNHYYDCGGGLYRVDSPDAAWLTGVKKVQLQVKVDTDYFTMEEELGVVQTGDVYAQLPPNLIHLAITDETGLVTAAGLTQLIQRGEPPSISLLALEESVGGVAAAAGGLVAQLLPVNIGDLAIDVDGKVTANNMVAEPSDISLLALEETLQALKLAVDTNLAALADELGRS
jgi:hypothetical protein